MEPQVSFTLKLRGDGDRRNLAAVAARHARKLAEAGEELKREAREEGTPGSASSAAITLVEADWWHEIAEQFRTGKTRRLPTNTHKRRG